MRHDATRRDPIDIHVASCEVFAVLLYTGLKIAHMQLSAAHMIQAVGLFHTWSEVNSNILCRGQLRKFAYRPKSCNRVISYFGQSTVDELHTHFIDNYTWDKKSH